MKNTSQIEALEVLKDKIANKAGYSSFDALLESAKHNKNILNMLIDCVALDFKNIKYES